MAGVYTRRVAGARVEGPATLPLFTASAGQIVILRDLLLANGGSGTVVAQLQIEGPGLSGPLYLLVANPLAAYEVRHLELRQELLAGEQLVLAIAAGSVSALATAYVFNA